MDRYNYAGIVITFLLFFFVQRLTSDGNTTIKNDFIFAIWVGGMYIINYGIPHVYRSLKGNNWNLSKAKSEPAFNFYAIGVILVSVSFPIIMPDLHIIYWLAFTGTIQVILFVYDLFVNGRH